MMRPCYSAILTHATPDKPAIVFVPTRKHVRLTAVDLLTSAAAEGNPHRCVRGRLLCIVILSVMLQSSKLQEARFGTRYCAICQTLFKLVVVVVVAEMPI